jgi:hypothetical protein
MEITIKEKTYKIKYTLRALFIYEEIKKEPFVLKSFTDYYLFFYCLLMANNEDLDISFTEFIDALDENPDLTVQITEYLNKEEEKNNLFGEKKKVVKN